MHCKKFSIDFFVFKFAHFTHVNMLYRIFFLCSSVQFCSLCSFALLYFFTPLLLFLYQNVFCSCLLFCSFVNSLFGTFLTCMSCIIRFCSLFPLLLCRFLIWLLFIFSSLLFCSLDSELFFALISTY